MNRTTKLTAAALLLALASSCTSLPTLESIKYGYSSTRIEGATEQPSVNDYNDVAAGWTPEPPTEAAAQRPLLGRDGTPVGAAQPGVVTETARPINDGVGTEANQGGSRSLLLDLYGDVVEERDELITANEDLSLALEMSETRANDFAEQLKALQAEFETLGISKQAADAQAFDLAARLATAQIARLEAERALLEATLEWRRMSANNNRPLEAVGGERP